MDEAELIIFLEKASEAYYTGNPIISDEEFDYLADLVNYNKVGYSSAAVVEKGQHKFKMFSLQKFYNKKDAPSFVDEVVTVKLDGAAISLLYYNGLLVQATTRGDGVEGEKIGHKVHYIPGCLDKAELGPGFIQLNGEVVAPKTVENARNYASGALHLKNAEEIKTRDLKFIVHGTYPYRHDTYEQDLANLEKLGFFVVDNPVWKDIYPTDGMVVRENNNDKYEAYGYTAKHPKGAYALKDASEVATIPTTLKDVVWQVGAGGKVTPVAIFDEVEIEGAKISRATLHNAGYIEELDLHLGDTLLITRRGGIIPYVAGKL